MAGNPTFEVLQSYRSWLAGVMPAMLDQSQGRTVPVFYSHPGDRVLGNAMVWFGEITDSYQVHSMRADVRRRQVRVEFEIIIAVVLQGVDRQQDCDEFANQIRQLIDLDIATDEHLHRADVVDVAEITDTRSERGTTVDGAGARITLRVAFDARFID